MYIRRQVIPRCSGRYDVYYILTMIPLRQSVQRQARFGSVSARTTVCRMISSSSTNRNTMIPKLDPSAMGPATPSPGPAGGASPAGVGAPAPTTPGVAPKFISKLTNHELASFILLSGATSSQHTIKLAASALPYTPNALVKAVVYPIYCGGETAADVLETGRKFLNRGVSNMMLSYSVEDAENTNSKEKSALMASAVNEICKSMDEILVKQYDTAMEMHKQGELVASPSQGFVALKPTGLIEGAADILLNFNKPEYSAKWEQYLEVCRKICRYAEEHGQDKVVVVFDAEKKVLQEGVYAVQREMMKEFNTNGKTIVVGTIQMYLQESVELVKQELALAEQGNYQLGLKLVRGAYLHSEPDRWNVIHKSKEESDASYNEGVNILLNRLTSDFTAGKTSPVGQVVVASHNPESITMVDEFLQTNAVPDNSVVFGQLMGMADDFSTDLADRGRKVVKYVPWGPAQETKEYLVRRLEENGDAAREGGWSYVKYGLLESVKRLVGNRS